MRYEFSFRCEKAPYLPPDDFLEIFGRSMIAINDTLGNTHKTEEYHMRKKGKNIDIVIGTRGKGREYVWCRWGSDICAVSEDEAFIREIRFQLRGNYVTDKLVRLKPEAIKVGMTMAQLLTELGVDEYKPEKVREDAEQLALIQ